MKLFKHTHFQPIQIEGESSDISSRNVQIGGRVGSGIVEGIEATPMGIVVRRSGDALDLLLSPSGVSFLKDKQERQPAQLKGGK